MIAYYYTRDHLASVREILNSSGSIVARYSYDPYGRTTLVSGSNLATFQYAGYYQRQASGLEFAVFRAFDPNTGRWLNRDLIGEAGGSNLYDYVLNGPTYSVDSLGLCAEIADTAYLASKWHLQSYKLGDGIPWNYTMTYHNVIGTWTAQVHVTCKCKCGIWGQYGTKIFTSDPIQIDPLTVGDATATPTHFGDTLIIGSVEEAVGAAAANGFSNSIPKIQSPLTPDQSKSVDTALRNAAPTNADQGSWVGGSPCSKLNL